MNISSIGKGLSILICCDFIVSHDWMSFLTFWSIRKNLPDATVSVVCKRRANADIFKWTRKCSVPIIFHTLDSVSDIKEFALRNPKSKVSEPVLLVKPSVVFVRDFEEAGFNPSVCDKNSFEIDGLIANVKSQNPTVCCDYSDGWGNFVTSTWINKSSIPFSVVDYSTGTMSANEKRLAALWESASKMYQSILRG